LVLRQVVIEADTIRGRLVPVSPHVPDSAAAVPRATIDSIRLVLPDNNWLGVGFLAGLAMGVGGMLVLFNGSGGT
jgi:hypothetical protein